MSDEIMFSIVIPARNEETTIGRCIEAIYRSASLAATTVEIVVVINRCSDQTELVARNLGCIIVQNESRNLGQIRNAGARIARGKFIVTIDADSWMSPRMLSRVLAVMSSERYMPLTK